MRSGWSAHSRLPLVSLRTWTDGLTAKAGILQMRASAPWEITVQLGSGTNDGILEADEDFLGNDIPAGSEGPSDGSEGVAMVDLVRWEFAGDDPNTVLYGKR